MKTMKNILAISLLLIATNASAQLSVWPDGTVYTESKLVSGSTSIYFFDRDPETLLNVYSYISSNPTYSGQSLVGIYSGFSYSHPLNPNLLTATSSDGAYFGIKSSGYVGLFNDNPSCALEVGSPGWYQQIKLNGNLIIGSDERIKNNIKDISNTRSKILQMRSVSYSFKQAPSSPELDSFTVIGKDNKKIKIKRVASSDAQRTHFGFLAQDVQKLFPELVYKDSAGMLGVDYIGMIPLLVNSIKEQQVQIDEQAKKIEQLTQLLDNSNFPSKKIKAADMTGSDALSLPVLDQNVPNPFTASTTISFFLPSTIGTASIYVYDMNGSQLKSYSITERGKGSVTIQGSEFNAGMYLYALIADAKVIDTKRMILTK